MRLRKPCEHGLYDGHPWKEGVFDFPTGARWCPGGEFLPEDALVIEKAPDWGELEMVMRPHTFDHDDAADAALNAKAWFLALAANQVGKLG